MVDFHYVNCLGERDFEVIRMPAGVRIGTYPTLELARKVVRNADTACRAAARKTRKPTFRSDYQISRANKA